MLPTKILFRVQLPKLSARPLSRFFATMSVMKKTVLITGCSDGGIGGALAEAFHQKGYHVFATARTVSKISSSLAASSDVTVLKLDVLSSESITAAVDSVAKSTGGKLDVLINNSGAGGEFLAGLDSSAEEGRKLFDLNFWAVLAMVKAFIPLLIKAKGCVVNNTSVAGAMGIPFQSMCLVYLRPINVTICMHI